MHKLLDRQLKKHFQGAPPKELAGFLAAVDQAYCHADRDRELVESSLELASQELLERNRQLRRDLEARKRLELELRQAEKLRAVGQLASGIAHEINTPVQYIGDNLSFLKDALVDLLEFTTLALESSSLPAQCASRRDDLQYLHEQLPLAVAASLEGCQRVAELVGAMKIFAHPDARHYAWSDINQAISSTLVVARNRVRYVADVELDLNTLPEVECMLGDINQVFLNLIVNAADAISDRHQADGRRGLIRVTTRAQAERVVVEVSDNGSGIPVSAQSRIFEPFFTTKDVGRGTGQGLAISRAIVVERHAGSLSFVTTVGEGTTFKLELPIERQAPPSQAYPPSQTYVTSPPYAPARQRVPARSTSLAPEMA